MRRSAPQTPPREQRSHKTFTIIGTTALGCTLALSPALPAFNTAPAALAHEEHGAGAAQAEPRSYTGITSCAACIPNCSTQSFTTENSP